MQATLAKTLPVRPLAPIVNINIELEASNTPAHRHECLHLDRVPSIFCRPSIYYITKSNSFMEHYRLFVNHQHRQGVAEWTECFEFPLHAADTAREGLSWALIRKVIITNLFWNLANFSLHSMTNTREHRTETDSLLTSIKKLFPHNGNLASSKSSISHLQLDDGRPHLRDARHPQSHQAHRAGCSLLYM